MKNSEYTVLDLINAARTNNKELLNIIVGHVDVNSVTPSDSIFGTHNALEVACKKCHPEIIKTLLKLGAKFRPENDNQEIIKHILSVNTHRFNCIPARIETIRLMLENGLPASEFISAINSLNPSIIIIDDIIAMIRQLPSFNIYHDAVTSEEYLRSARIGFLEEEIEDEYHLVAPEKNNFFAIAVTQLNSDTPIHMEWLEERANSLYLSDEAIRCTISIDPADSLLSELANFLQANLYIYTDSITPTIIRASGIALSTIRIALIDNHYFSIENIEDDTSSVEILIEGVDLIAVDLHSSGDSFVSLASRQLCIEQQSLQRDIINYFTQHPLEHDMVLALNDYLDQTANNIGQSLANAVNSRIYVYTQDYSEILRIIEPETYTNNLIRFTINNQGHYISLEEASVPVYNHNEEEEASVPVYNHTEEVVAAGIILPPISSVFSDI
jgi:hypothetical protein